MLKQRRQVPHQTANLAAELPFSSSKRRRKPGTTAFFVSLLVACVLIVTIACTLRLLLSRTRENERKQISHNKTTKLTPTNMLSSRNWRYMATCESVPETYYTLEDVESWCTFPFPTECKHAVEDMMAWFQFCQGTIWIRLQSRQDGDLDTFIQHVLPNMSHEFDLITTDGDTSVPGGVPHAGTLLESPLLKRWFTQNYDGTSHPKLHPIPIGLDMHSFRPGLWSSTDWDENLLQMKYIREKGRGHQTYAVWIPPMSTSTTGEGGTGGGERERARKIAKECGAIENPDSSLTYMLVDELWESYAQYRFGLSPPGHGMDCHRTWEMLFFGMIPIIKTSALDAVYKDLPVLIVQDWTDLCQEGFLDREYMRLREKLPLPEEAFTTARYMALARANS